MARPHGGDKVDKRVHAYVPFAQGSVAIFMGREGMQGIVEVKSVEMMESHLALKGV